MNDPLDNSAASNLAPWPDPLLTQDGLRVSSPLQWPARRQEIAALMLPLAYGPLPDVPESVGLVCLHQALLRRQSGTRLLHCRVEPAGTAAFHVRLFVPPGNGPFPVIISGDGCWQYADEAVRATMLARGYVFAEFNRVEIAADPDSTATCLAQIHAAARPRTLAIWAWAFHRVVDALQSLAWIDPAAITVVGHSRGGKAALLAGATDTRIALTSANNSGAGGAGCWRHRGPGAETLADILARFDYWFDPRLRAFAGRESELPFDQHFLKALVAPRALLTTEALDDRWANPQGSWQTHRAAQRVFDLLGAADKAAIVFRVGGHDHCLADWICLMDFADAVLRGMPQRRPIAIDPFPDLPAPLQIVAGGAPIAR